MINRRTLLAGVPLLMAAGPLPAQPLPSGRFPLAVSPDKRHVVDGTGAPFLIHGDTAWSLIADLTREETLLYLDDRSARGFNTILVSLIEHKFATDAPRNAYGEDPFLAPGDFSQPNQLYFDQAEWVINQALQRGLLVLLTPAYLGFGGGDEGWYREMIAAGPEALRTYGGFVGRRFAHLPNIMWLHGGDYDPPDRGLVRAVADGLADAGAAGIATAHGAPDSITGQFWKGEPWLAMDTVYTYGNVHGLVLERYQQSDMAVLMLETAYENEHGSTEETLRMAAYGALLGGAAGHIFGNNPIWHFSGPGIYDTGGIGWQEALASRGAQSMTHLKALFDTLDWWLLKPTPADGPVHGIGAQRIFTAASSDGSLLVSYLVDAQAVVVHHERSAGAGFSAQWFDPSTGVLTDAGALQADDSGAVRMTPPARLNGNGFHDWVLVLKAEA